MICSYALKEEIIKTLSFLLISIENIKRSTMTLSTNEQYELYMDLLRENRIECENNFFMNNKTLKLNKKTIVYLK